MKKIITLGLLAIFMATYAQAAGRHTTFKKTGKTPSVENNAASKTTGIVSGTLFPASFGASSACASSISIYGDGSVGYLTGVNVFGDKEILMRYKLSNYALGTPATLDTVFGFFGFKYQAGNGKVRAKVYSATTSGTPATLLGTSADVPVSSIDTSGGKTNFVFSTPVALTTNAFFVSIDVSSLYATGDTVALFSTDDQCPTTDTLAAWTKQSDGTFLSFADGTNWDFAIDIAIFAHVTANQVSVSNTIINTLKANVYPQPATGTVNVAFTSNENGKINIYLKDITGKLIADNNIIALKGASYKIPFDVRTLGNGLYFVEINSGLEKGMLKVIVGQ